MKHYCIIDIDGERKRINIPKGWYVVRDGPVMKGDRLLDEEKLRWDPPLKFNSHLNCSAYYGVIRRTRKKKSKP